MGLGWIEVDANLRTHRKAVHLAALVGDRRAWTYLVELWCWASQNEPTGIIRGAAARMVLEQVIGWSGEPGKLADAMIESRWVDAQEDGLYIHDWHEHQGAHIAKAEKDAERKRQTRERVERRYRVQRTSSGRPADGAECPQDGAKSPADGARNRNTNKNTNTNVLPSEGSDPADAGRELTLQPTTSKKRREPSEKERLFDLLEKNRQDVSGGVVPQAFGAARINSMLEPLLQFDPDVLRDAHGLYLRDDYAGGRDPPWPIELFVSQVARWVSQATRQSA